MTVSKNKNMKLNVLATMVAAACMALASCSHQRPETSPAPTASVSVPAPNYLPKARIYKTNGDFAQLVPITLNSARTEVVSYPAPSDLRDAAPVALSDGWLLDRRGISYQSAFLTMTYAEYAALNQPPTRGQLLGLVKPGARITEIVEMPFPYSPGCEAECEKLIASGLKGCTVLKP